MKFSSENAEIVRKTIENKLNAIMVGKPIGSSEDVLIVIEDVLKKIGWLNRFGKFGTLVKLNNDKTVRQVHISYWDKNYLIRYLHSMRNVEKTYDELNDMITQALLNFIGDLEIENELLDTIEVLKGKDESKNIQETDDSEVITIQG